MGVWGYFLAIFILFLSVSRRNQRAVALIGRVESDWAVVDISLAALLASLNQEPWRVVRVSYHYSWFLISMDLTVTVNIYSWEKHNSLPAGLILFALLFVGLFDDTLFVYLYLDFLPWISNAHGKFCGILDPWRWECMVLVIWALSALRVLAIVIVIGLFRHEK